MTAIVVAPRLDEFNTVPIDRFGHRLALGVQWIDALSEQPLADPWTTELERIGARPLVKRFIAHGQGRHALLHRDAVARLLRLAASELAAFPPPAADPSLLVLRGHGADRRHVPRRVALTPLTLLMGADGEPPVSTANIRRLRLWPGAEYPVPAGGTVLRGRIRRGAALASAQPVPWARMVITRPAGAAPFPALPVFGDETPVGWAHGDDRGEFVAVLGAAALPGGALLPTTLPLTVWVSLPVAIALDPEDALASLPLEAAGTTLSGAVLDGTALPPGHVRQVGFRISIPPGQTTVLPDADLRFA